MIYYECYHINKSYNFNTKLNYIFNNMEHQTLVTLDVVCFTNDYTLVRLAIAQAKNGDK